MDVYVNIDKKTSSSADARMGMGRVKNENPVLWVNMKGKERKGKERKGKERKGKERKGKERKGNKWCD